MTKTPRQSVPSLNRIIKHNLAAFSLLLGVLTVDLWGRKTSDDPRMQMIETLSKRNYDALNQSDIDSIMSLVTKSVRTGKNFHYMWKLRDAMERETKRLDAAEDDSSKDWLIQAFRPVAYDDTWLSFTECAICKKTLQTTRCDVTRVELLVPLIHTDSKTEMNNDWIFVEINGRTVNSSRGTMDISRAVTFDLSNILLKPHGAMPDGVLNITVKKHPCRNVFSSRCMLYEYCNINNTILNRFRTHHRKENKQHTDVVDDRQTQNSINTSESESKHNDINGNVNRSEHNSKPSVSQKQAQKVAQGKQSLVSLQPTMSSTPPATDVDNLQAYNSSEYHNNTEVVTDTPHTLENESSGQVPSYREIRSLRKLRAVVSPQIMMENSNQATEQPQQHKKKRQLEIPNFRDLTKQKLGACGSNFEPVQEECKRRPFYVSFQRDMHRWDIIVPESVVDIGYCSSTCRHSNHFSNVNSRLTAHAVIVNSMRGDTPPVICSPRKMSSISILKISDGGSSLVVENLLNAKIESCWCT